MEKKVMKKIVLSAIIAIAATVGVYHIALLMGAREPVAAAAAAAVVVVVAFAFVVAFAVAFAAAKELGVPYRWVLGVYAMEAVTIFAALTVGSVIGSMAIAIGGIAAILLLWRLYHVKHCGMIKAATPAQ